MDDYFHRTYRQDIENTLFQQAFQATLARRTFRPYAEFKRVDTLVPLDNGFLDLMQRIDDLHANGEPIPTLIHTAMTEAFRPYTQSTPRAERIEAKVAACHLWEDEDIDAQQNKWRTYYEAYIHDIPDDEAFYALFPDIAPDQYSMRILHGAFKGHAVKASLKPLDPELYHIGLRSHVTRLIEHALFTKHVVRSGECDDITHHMFTPPVDECADWRRRELERIKLDPLHWVHLHWALAGRLDDETLAAIRAAVKPYKTDTRITSLSGDDAHDLLFRPAPREAYISELMLDLFGIEAHPELYIDTKP